MKICISSTDKELDANVDQRFGRCKYFLILETDTMKYRSISNESNLSSGGAGIQAAQTVAKTGAEIVITGNIGPNAFYTLSSAGIKVFTDNSGRIDEIIKKYKKGELKETETFNTDSHSGLRR
jgi:predicted Fe-Mo cluster-binding NifX family protein